METKHLEEIKKHSLRISELVKELEKPADLEKGKWYKGGHALLCWSGDKDNCYGFYKGAWDKEWSFEGGHSKPLTELATPSEVQAALQNYAEKLGFKPGVRFLGATGDIYTVTEGPLKFWTEEDMNYLCLYPSNLLGCIFNNKTGKWAEIISKPEIKAGEYYVVTDSNRKEYNKVGRARNKVAFNSNYWEFYGLENYYTPDQVSPASPEQIKEFNRVTIAGYEVEYVNEEDILVNGQQSSYHELVNMKYVLNFKGVKSLNFLGSDVTLEDINKVLNGFNK